MVLLCWLLKQLVLLDLFVELSVSELLPCLKTLALVLLVVALTLSANVHGASVKLQNRIMSVSKSAASEGSSGPVNSEKALLTRHTQFGGQCVFPGNRVHSKGGFAKDVLACGRWCDQTANCYSGTLHANGFCDLWTGLALDCNNRPHSNVVASFTLNKAADDLAKQAIAEKALLTRHTQLGGQCVFPGNRVHSKGGFANDVLACGRWCDQTANCYSGTLYANGFCDLWTGRALDCKNRPQSGVVASFTLNKR